MDASGEQINGRRSDLRHQKDLKQGRIFRNPKERKKAKEKNRSLTFSFYDTPIFFIFFTGKE